MCFRKVEERREIKPLLEYVQRVNLRGENLLFDIVHILKVMIGSGESNEKIVEIEERIMNDVIDF